MNEFWISLQSIPPAGQTKIYDDQAVWQSVFSDFSLPCRIISPLSAQVFILAQESGVLFKGSVQGTIGLPCDRCTEESVISFNEEFATMEPYPDVDRAARLAQDKRLGRTTAPEPEEEDPFLEGVDEEVIRPAQRGNGFEINPLAYIWQELALALPVKPLCQDDCKGLCPKCGCNMNNESCSCNKHEGDPRLAALCSVKISK